MEMRPTRIVSMFLLPLKLLADSAPEMLLKTTNGNDLLYKYKKNTCLVLPCNVLHQTCHQQGERKHPDNLRIMLSMDVGPISKNLTDDTWKKAAEYCFPHYPNSTVLLSEDDFDDQFNEWKESLRAKN